MLVISIEVTGYGISFSNASNKRAADPLSTPRRRYADKKKLTLLRFFVEAVSSSTHWRIVNVGYVAAIARCSEKLRQILRRNYLIAKYGSINIGAMEQVFRTNLFDAQLRRFRHGNTPE